MAVLLKSYAEVRSLPIGHTGSPRGYLLRGRRAPTRALYDTPLAVSCVLIEYSYYDNNESRASQQVDGGT